MITARPAGPMNFPRLDMPYTNPKPLARKEPGHISAM
jgi:hypothetical protein